MPSNSLPTLRGSSAQVLYEFSKILSFHTLVHIFQNGSEQRRAHRGLLHGFKLPMGALSATDKANWLTFHTTMKGRGQVNGTLTLAATAYSGAATYNNMALESDDLVSIARMPVNYDQQVSLRQVANYPWSPPSIGSTYPNLAFGGNSMRPTSQISTFLTSVGDSPNGQRFAYSWYGAGLSNFPTGYLRMWKISYPLVSDADAQTLETFFLGNMGKYGSFSFIDPIDGSTYTHVRFDMDEMEVRYLTLNNRSTTVTLRQTNGS